MSNTDYSRILCEKIMELRKKHGFTQDAMAEKLGISFQAVSKWENGLSCPDIALLPLIADIFGVHIDELFGRESTSGTNSSGSSDVPWDEDGKLRAVVYKGRKLMREPLEDAGKFSLEYDGDVTAIDSFFPVTCGDVGGNVDCNDGDVSCGDISGNASAGNSVNCGDIGGAASAGGAVNCGDIGGDAKAGGSVSCGDVGGDVNAGGTVTCGDVGGRIDCKNGSGYCGNT